MKKFTPLKWILLGVFIILAVLVSLVIFIPKDKPNDVLPLDYCESDLDCVSSSCCHPTSCVNKDYAPNCEGVMCTMDCRIGTLDCGQGSCKCIDNKCSAQIGEEFNKPNTQIANPASVNCIELGGELEIRENELGQYGVCIKSGKECEEWKLFRGECRL